MIWIILGVLVVLVLMVVGVYNGLVKSRMQTREAWSQIDVQLKRRNDLIPNLIENQPIRLLDIGAGAGFPSLPMKILFPELDVTIIDSLNKRINFLHLLAEELGLSGVHFYHGRAEDFAQDKAFRAQFDIVTARAVARMQVLAELTIPYLKVGGRLLALKASNAPEELEEAKNALNLLFSKVEDNLQYELPNGDPRYITLVEKKKETPNKYPRKAGIPNKRPL